MKDLKSLNVKTETYLEPKQASMMKLFVKLDKSVLVVRMSVKETSRGICFSVE